MQLKLRFNPVKALALATIPTAIVWSVGATVFQRADVQTVYGVSAVLGLVWTVLVVWCIVENITIVQEDREDAT